MVKIFKLGGVELTEETVRKLLIKSKETYRYNDEVDDHDEIEEKEENIKCKNSMLESFLNGFIIYKRGKQDPKPGQPEIPVLKNSENHPNNILLKKLKIALSLTSDDMLDILKEAGEHHEVEIFDMMVEQASLTRKLAKVLPEVVGITSLCIDVFEVLNLCREAKTFNSEIMTMVGGTQAFLSPRSFADQSVDYIFEFVDESNLKKLFKCLDLAKGDKQHTEETIASIPGIRTRFNGFTPNGVKGRNQYLLPNRESTSRYRPKYSYFGYKPAAIMEFGTGCAKGCEFCLRWRIEGSEEKLIDRELIKKDLESIQEPTIMLVDNDFFASEQKLRTFFSLVRELRLQKNFIVYASVKGILSYEPLVKEFKDLGLIAVIIGYESFNDTELADYRKKSDTHDNLKAAKILEQLGIDVGASFIAHPDWSKEDFRKLRSTVNLLKPQISSVNPLTPFPNLPLYDKYKDRLLYSSVDYKSWSFEQVMISPSKLSLRGYYYELLLTNLYVNLVVNRKTEMIKRYGFIRVIRLAAGSVWNFLRYCRLMLR